MSVHLIEFFFQFTPPLQIGEQKYFCRRPILSRKRSECAFTPIGLPSPKCRGVEKTPCSISRYGFLPMVQCPG